jgi:hypothetical protein
MIYGGILESFANMFALSGSGYPIVLGSVAVLTMLFAPRWNLALVRGRLSVEWLGIARKMPTIATEDDARGRVYRLMVPCVFERAIEASDSDAPACFGRWRGHGERRLQPRLARTFSTGGLPGRDGSGGAAVIRESVPVSLRADRSEIP